MWEQIYGVFRFDIGYVWDGGQQFVCEIMLFVKVVGWYNQIVNVLVIIECGLDVVLCWYIGVQMY